LGNFANNDMTRHPGIAPLDNVDRNATINSGAHHPGTTPLGASTSQTPETRHHADGGGILHRTVLQPFGVTGALAAPSDEAKPAETPPEHDQANLIEEEEVIGVVGSDDEIRLRVAFDTGAVGNVMGPDSIPANAKVKPNTTGKNFVGPSGETIMNHGSCDTMISGEHGKVGCSWKVADVTRALHSGAQVTGPVDNPKQDVLMNAAGIYVVAPGVVKELMKKMKPVMEYKREGNLYLADVTMTGFTRQVPGM
jgi:hypothetical protein